MNRLIGIILAGVWLLAMAALIHRDVLPLWTAQAPPTELLPVGEYQVGIFNQAGHRIGTSRVSSTPTPLSMIRAKTLLDAEKIVGMLPVAGQWVFTTDLSYDDHDVLDHCKFTLNAPGVYVEVNAERLERDFSVIAKLGHVKKTMLLDGELSRHLSETLRPFTHLEDLHVGQRWRIRLLDPFQTITSQSIAFHTQIAQVTRLEAINHHGREVECFRVESPSATAWADRSGRVLKQEVQIPLVGRWTLVDEPPDRVAPKSSNARGKAD